jgi:Family of unknown function (DUF6510)
MKMSIDEHGAVPLDGNAAAGLLTQVFACEMTVAVVTCGGCGAATPLGAARAFGGAMGAILRCAACDTIVMRLARTPRGFWLDMRGARSVLVPDGR